MPMKATIERAAHSVEEFCTAHDITKQTFYRMVARGIAPRIMKVGTRTLISAEAAAEWRREREANAVLMPPRHGRRQTEVAAPAVKAPEWKGRIKAAGATGAEGA